MDGIETVKKAGKAPGILTADKALARSYLAAGALFVAVGVDNTLLVRGAQALIAEFKSPGVSSAEKGPYG